MLPDAWLLIELHQSLLSLIELVTPFYALGYYSSSDSEMSRALNHNLTTLSTLIHFISITVSSSKMSSRLLPCMMTTSFSMMPLRMTAPPLHLQPLQTAYLTQHILSITFNIAPVTLDTAHQLVLLLNVGSFFSGARVVTLGVRRSSSSTHPEASSNATETTADALASRRLWTLLLKSSNDGCLADTLAQLACCFCNG